MISAPVQTLPALIGTLSLSSSRKKGHVRHRVSWCEPKGKTWTIGPAQSKNSILPVTLCFLYPSRVPFRYPSSMIFVAGGLGSHPDPRRGDLLLRCTALAVRLSETHRHHGGCARAGEF
jgi:hypothetical protein